METAYRNLDDALNQAQTQVGRLSSHLGKVDSLLCKEVSIYDLVKEINVVAEKAQELIKIDQMFQKTRQNVDHEIIITAKDIESKYHALMDE